MVRWEGGRVNEVVGGVGRAVVVQPLLHCLRCEGLAWVGGGWGRG